MNKKIKYIVGIDEVGRGPLAGPICFCAFKMPVKFDAKKFGTIKDSKKLTALNREAIFSMLQILKKDKKVDYALAYESAKSIDKIGLSRAVKNCIEKALKNLKIKPNECSILLDGGLKAPEIYKNQKTIIKGDEKERAIAFASIIAKVSRDALMKKLAQKYPKYGFEIHKGYGTKKHRELIIKFGLSFEHRESFCKNILS